MQVNFKTVSLLVGLVAGPLHAQQLVPLAASNTWSLGNPYVTEKITYSIVDDAVYGGVRAVRLRFAAPWTTTDFLLNADDQGNGLWIDGVGIGTDNYRFSLPAPFIRYGAVAGEHWTHPLGAVSLIASGLSISAPAGSFTNVREYALYGTDGSVQFWYIAPGIGFVQYRIGNAVFQLEHYTLQNSEAVPPVTRPSSCPPIGIHANTAANVTETDTTRAQRLDQAYTSGSRLIHITYNWNQIEKTPGVYDLKEVQKYAAQANRLGLRIILTIRAIDADKRRFPADLASRALNDTVVLSRFRQAVRATVAAAGSRVRWVNLANEVDLYLTDHQPEIAPFLQLYAAGAAGARSALSSVSTGVIFSHSNTRYYDAVLRALQPSLGHLGFTYYHFADWKMKPLWVVSRDIAELTAWAKGKPVIFTEIGAPADPSLGSSAEFQAQFYSAVFDTLRLEGTRVAAAHFFLMSDLSAATVDHMQSYYDFYSPVFGAYLSTLGVFDRNGTPKPAWYTFRERAVQSNAGGCTTY
jgi:hypothetical protein